MRLLGWKLELFLLCASLAGASLLLYVFDDQLASVAQFSYALVRPSAEVELAAINTQSRTLYDAGKYPEAAVLAQKYVAGIRTLHGENSSKYATALNNLAVLFQETNRLAEAEPLFRRALEIYEAIFGPDHSPTDTPLGNLAQLYEATNRLSDAGLMMRRALSIAESTFGPNHPNTAVRLSNLAALLGSANRFFEAEPLLRRALKIRLCGFGVNIRTSRFASTIWRQFCRRRIGFPRPILKEARPCNQREGFWLRAP